MDKHITQSVQANFAAPAYQSMRARQGVEKEIQALKEQLNSATDKEDQAELSEALGQKKIALQNIQAADSLRQSDQATNIAKQLSEIKPSQMLNTLSPQPESVIQLLSDLS